MRKENSILSKSNLKDLSENCVFSRKYNHNISKTYFIHFMQLFLFMFNILNKILSLMTFFSNVIKKISLSSSLLSPCLSAIESIIYSETADCNSVS